MKFFFLPPLLLGLSFVSCAPVESPSSASRSSQASSAFAGVPSVALVLSEGFVFRTNLGYHTLAFFGTNLSADGAVFTLSVSVTPPGRTPLAVHYYMSNFLIGTAVAPSIAFTRNLGGWAWGLFPFRAVAVFPEGNADSASVTVNCYMTNYVSPDKSGVTNTFRIRTDTEFNYLGNYEPGNVVSVRLGSPSNGWSTNYADTGWDLVRSNGYWIFQTDRLASGTPYKYVIWTTNSGGILNLPVWVHDEVNYRVQSDGFAGLNSVVP